MCKFLSYYPPPALSCCSVVGRSPEVTAHPPPLFRTVTTVPTEGCGELAPGHTASFFDLTWIIQLRLEPRLERVCAW